MEDFVLSTIVPIENMAVAESNLFWIYAKYSG